MKQAALVFVLAGTLGSFGVAHAESPDPAVLKTMYDSGRNMSGLINHCVDKGFLKADSAENASKMVTFVANIPGEFDKSDGDKNEAQGRKGEFFQDGEFKNLEKNASLSLKDWCQQADAGLRKGLKSVGL